MGREYDKFDRAAAYKQTTTDAFGHTQVLEFSGGEYNVYDDLLAYTEKTTENGETKSRVFTNGVNAVGREGGMCWASCRGTTRW
ncbi:MAG: hypothetical protein IPP09_05510 [Elusimicrobia bacterium]|nr:hypothetical protein [Elusimicrobiota bacterium]